MKKIIIIGAGGHGQVVADALLLMKEAEPVAFLDENPALIGTEVLGIPVPGGNSYLSKIEHDGVVLALGNNALRKRIFEELTKAGENLFTVIHPSAIISPSVKIGAGCMILAGAVINTGAEIKDNTIINTNSTIEHHNMIGPHAHIAPGSTLGGEVTVGEESMVGIGATVLPRVIIGNKAMLGAGSTATRKIPDGVTAAGMPAKRLKF
ncbi:sugar O-acyltransferase, sialic acid O-acetyltransferase NeuD family [Maridesulfovibrio ferrireducens]|uniref:Sugar O-acyltransferase, sialic acid O-acetyltransferase NeuD family n=1 Tax=Maridesulfovibrio ferrireducens TaxID=246191 RepID=A0A1G9CRD7_9BACT|nr:acetyltransferase [Maridesulfovibrio ferrireducens]SDK54240.1 sugar O-acyltransferase, sialic acid O-acetyltransferase NeuD family [Maridesulfovibrio ferrireducens]